MKYLSRPNQVFQAFPSCQEAAILFFWCQFLSDSSDFPTNSRKTSTSDPENSYHQATISTSFPGSFDFPQEGVVDNSLLFEDERPRERGCHNLRLSRRLNSEQLICIISGLSLSFRESNEESFDHCLQTSLIFVMISRTKRNC